MPVSDYTPVLEAVAAHIPTRTRTEGGNEAGTFNPAAADEEDRTRPTAEQATAAITNALGTISGTIGIDIPEENFEAAASVAALRAAMLIELRYWPEQVATGRSPYAQLKELYDEQWKDLLSSMGIASDDGGGAVPATAGYPSGGGFPETAIGMEHPW